MSTIILGIDPGSRVTGFGLISWHQGDMKAMAHGAIQLAEKAEFSLRMGELSQQIQKILDEYRPHYVVVESIFLGKNTQSAFKLGHARGVIMAEAAKSGSLVCEYATRLVKKGITGTGAAEKDHVRQVLQVLLNLRQIHPIDASDALAMAYFHGLELQKKKLTKRMLEA